MSDSTPDVEPLILRTAFYGSVDPRTFGLAITWLSRYGSLIAEHRLCRMIQESLARDETCGLGFMLDVALRHTRPHDRKRNLERPMQCCAPAASPRPYFAIDCEREAMRRRAERRASVVSRSWNLWVEPLELNYDALRPAAWLIAQNPELAFRADLRGDLRATILIALQERAASANIGELSRLCGVTRLATGHAVDHLELARRVTCRREGRSRRVQLAA